MPGIDLYVTLIIVAALAQYTYFSFKVGQGRSKYGIKAPKTVGDEIWERLYRVQMNTLELLIVFIPAIILFGQLIGGKWSLLPGIAFIVGRAIYARQYVINPPSRIPGVALSILSNIGMLLVIAVAAIMAITK